MVMNRPTLQMLPASEYIGLPEHDPIRFYGWPVLGALYRRRVELCLAELHGGGRVLEVGYGTGVTFLNLGAMYQEIHGVDLHAPAEAVAHMWQGHGLQPILRQGNVLELPYPEGYFDSVLLISILEHLRPAEQPRAFEEICRALRPGGQVVYGVPVERPLMALMFRLLGVNIREHHWSTERDVAAAAAQRLRLVRLVPLTGPLGLFGQLYQVGHFVRAA